MNPNAVAGLAHEITREQFRTMETDEKLDILFDVLMMNRKTQLEQCGICAKRATDCGERMTKIENRKYFDKAVSAIAGAIGGAVAYVLGWKV